MNDLVGNFHITNCSNYVIGLAVPEVKGVCPVNGLLQIFRPNLTNTVRE